MYLNPRSNLLDHFWTSFRLSAVVFKSFNAVAVKIFWLFLEVCSKRLPYSDGSICFPCDHCHEFISSVQLPIFPLKTSFANRLPTVPRTLSANSPLLDAKRRIVSKLLSLRWSVFFCIQNLFGRLFLKILVFSLRRKKRYLLKILLMFSNFWFKVVLSIHI